MCRARSADNSGPTSALAAFLRNASLLPSIAYPLAQQRDQRGGEESDEPKSVAPTFSSPFTSMQIISSWNSTTASAAGRDEVSVHTQARRAHRMGVARVREQAARRRARTVASYFRIFPRRLMIIVVSRLVPVA